MADFLQKPDGTQVAIRTGPNVNLPWFVFVIDGGGYYTDGATEDFDEWIPLIAQQEETP